MGESSVITSLSLMLDKEMYALDIASVREIQDHVDVTRIPQTPAYMPGVVNLRGKAIPVFDLRMKFGMGETVKTLASRIVILETSIEGELCEVGVLADAVREVFAINLEQLLPPPKAGRAVGTGLLRGLARYEERFIMLLETDRLFSDEDCGLIKDMEEEAPEAPEASELKDTVAQAA